MASNAWSSPYRSIGSTLFDAGLLANGGTLWFSYVEDVYNQNLTNLDYSFALTTAPFSNVYGTKQDLTGDNQEGIGVTNWRYKIYGGYWQDVGDADGTSERNTVDTLQTVDAGPNSRLLMVGKIEWGATDSDPETLTLYMPGPDLTLGTPVLDSWQTAALTQSAFNTVAVGWKDSTAQMDEIRFGKSYEEVINFPTLSWDLNGSTAGAGSATPAGVWDAATANWNADMDGAGATGAWAAGMVARFGAGTDATGAYTVTVEGVQDIWGLTFDEGTVTLAQGTGGGLRLVKDAAAIDVYTGVTATIAAPISDDGNSWALAKKGGGTLVLSGANTYTGATNIQAGTLQLGDNDVIPAGSAVTIAGNVAGEVAAWTSTATARPSPASLSAARRTPAARRSALAPAH